LLSTNLAAHSLAKVFFAFFALPLADENEQDHSFFLEGIHTLLMAHESRIKPWSNSACY